MKLLKMAEMSRKIRLQLEKDNVTYRERKLGENFCTRERLSKNCSFHLLAKNVPICQIKWSDDLSLLLTLQRLYLLPQCKMVFGGYKSTFGASGLLYIVHTLLLT